MYLQRSLGNPQTNSKLNESVKVVTKIFIEPIHSCWHSKKKFRVTHFQFSTSYLYNIFFHLGQSSVRVNNKTLKDRVTITNNYFSCARGNDSGS